MPLARPSHNFLFEMQHHPYLLAIVLVTVASIVRYALIPLLDWNAPLLIYTLPVAISAMYGGLRPALFTTALGAMVGSVLFIEPVLTFAIPSSVDVVRISVFLLIGVTISILGGQLEKSRNRSRESEERFRLVVQGARDFAIFC